MNKELIDQRRKLLFHDDVWFLLLKCVPRERVLSCLQSLGIVFNGIRPNKLSHDEMANALSDEFFTNYEAAQHIIALIDSHCACNKDTLPETIEQVKKLKKNLKSMQPPDVLGIVWLCSALQSAASAQCIDAIHSFMQ